MEIVPVENEEQLEQVRRLFVEYWASFGFTLIVIPYSLAFALLIPIISYRFAERERISDALDIGTILRLFKRNWQNTIVVALIVVGIESFAFVGIIFFLVGVLFTMFYTYLVSAHMHGQLYLEQAAEEEA